MQDLLPNAAPPGLPWKYKNLGLLQFVTVVALLHDKLWFCKHSSEYHLTGSQPEHYGYFTDPQTIRQTT